MSFNPHPEVRVVNTAKYDPRDKLPVYATSGSAAIDIRLAECIRVGPKQTVAGRTGLFMEIPQGAAGLLLPRSGLGSRGIVLFNEVGLIDSDYRGEIIVMVYNKNETGKPQHFEEGTRIAQLVLVPIIQPTFKLVNSLDATARGDGGFGHTGI